VRAAALLLPLLLHAAQARAGNDEQILLGNDAAMSGGAVTATASDGGALWYNVALIGAVERNQLDASGNLFSYRFNSVPQLLRASSGETAGAGGLEVNAVPSVLTFLRRLGPGIAGGFGLFVTDAQSYSQRAVLEAAGPPFTRVRGDSNDIRRNWHGTVGIGFRLSDTLRFGVRLFLDAENVQVDSTFFVDRGVGDASTDLLGQQLRLDLDVIGIGAGAGLHWAPGNGFELGVSVLSPRLDLAASFSTSSVLVAAAVEPGTEGTLTYLPTDVETLDLGVASTRPFMLRVGLAWRFARGWISVDADLRTPNIDQVLARRTGANVRLGGRFRLDEIWSLGGGLFTDLASSPPLDPAEDGIGSRRMSFLGGTFGVELRSRVGTAEGEDPPDLVFQTTVAVRYAYGWGQAVGLEVEVPPTVGPDREFLGASRTHEVSLHVGSGLAF
jgi:hypothetical protein